MNEVWLGLGDGKFEEGWYIDAEPLEIEDSHVQIKKIRRSRSVRVGKKIDD